MNKQPRTFLPFLIATAFWACHNVPVTNTVRPSTWAKKIDNSTFHNIYKVDNDLYRSEQPTNLSMKQIETMGIKTVLDLRRTRKDKVGDTNLVLKRVRINSFTISYEDVVKALRIISTAEKPVLVHCVHGSDRTGCIIAAYRMVKDGWTKEQAIDELIHGGYGYHQKWFPNIIKLLNSIDVEKLKNDIKN